MNRLEQAQADLIEAVKTWHRGEVNHPVLFDAIKIYLKIEKEENDPVHVFVHTVGLLYNNAKIRFSDETSSFQFSNALGKVREFLEK